MTGAAAGARRSDLPTRAATAVAMITVTMIALAAGGFPFWLLVAAASLVMLAEWAGMMRAERWRSVVALAALALALLSAATQMAARPGAAVALVLIAGGVVALIVRSARLGAGVAYAGLPALALLYVRAVPDSGVGLTLWTLAIIWATDIGAYFAGRRIGGARLAPRISPNKTWAGLAGGMAAALIVGAFIGVIYGLGGATRWLGAPLAVLAQGGDLFESWLKRRAGVKDSGWLLPGHGGALDRLDGLVPVAPVVALLLAANAL